MKKIVAFLLVLTMIAGLTGCALPEIRIAPDPSPVSTVPILDGTEPEDPENGTVPIGAAAEDTSPEESNTPGEAGTPSEDNGAPAENGSPAEGGTPAEGNTPAPGESAPSPSAPVVAEDHVHSYTKKVVAPTCTSKGYTLYTCSCGDSYKDNYTDALGHDFRDSTVAPTCTEKGYTLHKCSRCGSSSKDHYTNALGHNMVNQGDNGQYTKDNIGFYSTITYQCSRCGKTETSKELVRKWADFDTELIASLACNYAIEKYGCTRDTSLNLSNGSYYFGEIISGFSEAEIAAQLHELIDYTIEHNMYLDGETFDDIYGWYRCNVIVSLRPDGNFDMDFVYG